MAQRVKAPVCSVGVPYGCRFKSRLLHLRSWCLLLHLKGSKVDPRGWALSPTQNTHGEFLALAWHSLSCCRHLERGPASMEHLPLSLSPYLSNKQKLFLKETLDLIWVFHNLLEWRKQIWFNQKKNKVHHTAVFLKHNHYYIHFSYPRKMFQKNRIYNNENV